jgi:Protein of unknown function (DUF2812)
MSGERTRKTVFRMLWAWNDEKEGRWLAEQEKSGWRLSSVGYFGAYTFERAVPADVAYRLDFGPPARSDRDEYFALFRDAGWEHVGTRGPWQYFRKAAVDGHAPEIYTDPQSRIAMYRRVVALSIVMFAMVATITAHNLATRGSILDRHPGFLVLYVLLMSVFGYASVRLLLIIGRLKRGHPRPS